LTTPPSGQASAGSGERRIVSALFCDVVGSTSLAEAMDPEDWTDIVNQAVALMAESVERFEGTVAQFAGDSILALFGAPIAHEDDPYRAVRAGLHMLDSLGDFCERLSGEQDIRMDVRAGINTGLMVVGDVAAGGFNVYTALGDAANVAARMEALAEPGTLVISEDTYRLVSGDVDVDDLGAVTIKGKSEPIHAYVVRGVRGVTARRRGVPGFVSPMVGRSNELGTLAGLADMAAAGSGRVAAIIGEPGVGKSRLIAELGADIDDRDQAVWAVGRCAAYDEHRPYHLIASLVRAIAGTSDTAEPEAATAALRDVARPIFGDDQASTSHLLQLLGLESGHPDDDPTVLHSAYAEAVAGLIAGVAAKNRPLVLVCEDIHWSDASSAELLASLLRPLRQTPTLLVLVTRPDRAAHGWDVLERADRDLAEAFVDIRLEPLDADASRLLVANLLAIESLPDELRQLVLSKAEGNPFFIEELVRMLVDQDMVVQQDGRWIARSAIADLEVPTTLQGLLASRIDLLPADVRSTGLVAAVIGRRFESTLLAAVATHDLPAAADAVASNVSDLEAHGLVKLAATRPELAFSFRHALTHDVMYDSILKRRRRSLHGQVAAAIESLHPDRLEENAPILARHYAEAGDDTSALEYLVIAGRSALARHALPESHSFFSRAAALLEADPEAPVDMRIRVALLQAKAGMKFTPGNQTVATLEAVRADAEALGDIDLLARVYALLLEVRTMAEETYSDPAYRETMDRAYALAEEVSDPALRAILEGMMGQVLRSADEYQHSADLLTRSVPVLEEAGRVGAAGLNAAFAADVLAQMGRFEEAASWIDRGSELAQASGNPNVIADASLLRGRIASGRGDLEEALVHTTTGMETAATAGNIHCELVGNFMVADQQLRLGHAETAIPHLERSFELGEFCNADAMVALGHAWLTAAHAQLGDLEPDGFSGPLAMAQAGRSRSGEAMVRLHRGIAIAGGDAPDWELALADLERAEALFADIGARPDQARTIHARAMALDASGRTEESRAMLERAMEMFSDLGIQPDPIPA